MWGYRWGKYAYVYLCSTGIGFNYKGDEVIWMWPWKRCYCPKGCWRRAWLSISFEGTFRTLPELDRLWADYFEADRRSAMRSAE